MLQLPGHGVVFGICASGLISGVLLTLPGIGQAHPNSRMSAANLAPLYAESERPYFIATEHLKNLSMNKERLYQGKNGIAVNLLPVEAAALSERIHDSSFQCGGFLDLTVMIDEFGVDVETAARMADLEEPATPADVPADVPAGPAHPTAVSGTLAFISVERYRDALSRVTQFPDRASWSETGKRAAQWLHDTSLELARAAGRTDVTAEMIATNASYPQPSVVVRVPGRNASLPAVVIGGHMDTFAGDRPGADDDGSGTAAVLEALRAVVSSRLTFERDIYFMYYAAEEMGLVGSQIVVSVFRQRGIVIRGALQLDMIGYKSTRDDGDMYMISDNVNAELTTFVQKLAIAYAGVQSSRMRSGACGYACSDHASWHRAGVPAAFPFEASMNNYNRALHTARDRMDILDMDHATKFVKLAAAFAVEMAEPVADTPSN